MSPWFEALFSVGRPGSKTVVCDPPDSEIVIELARRGYRLLVLHDGRFEVAELRRQLRELGLSSQLMGSQSYGDGATETPLVADFYELWIFCASPEPLADLAMSCVKPGAPVLWRGEFPAPSELTLDSPWPGLPPCLAGFRSG